MDGQTDGQTMLSVAQLNLAECNNNLSLAAEPFKGTLKLQSNGTLYSNTVIGTLAADGWAVTFGTVRRALGVLRSVLHLRKITVIYGTVIYDT